MSHTPLQSPTWYDAITLAERAAALRVAPTTEPAVSTDVERAARRLDHWRTHLSNKDGAIFEQRLAEDGLTEDECLRLLGEPVEALRDRLAEPPSWLTALGHAFSRPAPSSSAPEPWREHGQEMGGFLDMIVPLIDEGREQLAAGVRRLADEHALLPIDPESVEDMLIAPLAQRLIEMVSRTMVLELHVARLEGRLSGATPADRFQSFLGYIRERETALTLLGEYPVLARQLVGAIEQWVAVSLEFLTRLCADWEAIQDAFSPEVQPGLLVEVSGGVGDRHREGRAVFIARFASGFQVVYKPRSLALDAHFQDLLAWVNAHGDHPPFRTLTVLDRGSYGWTEFVAAQGCGSPDEVRRFYQRQGGYLTILFALAATDFHFENVIAAGEHPMLVDLEALFHPRVATPEATKAEDLGDISLAESVYSIGLLPRRIWSNAESDGVDISGFGATEGQLTPAPVPYWEAKASDEMRLNRKRVPMSAGRHRPTIEGADVAVPDYGEEIVAGFTSIYRLLVAQREALLSDDGPLAPFAEDETRVIVRPTQTYARLLHESFHPDVLRRALDRDRLLDRLWLAAAVAPFFARIIPIERADLERGDIPLFTTHPTSRDVWSSAGTRIPDFLEASGMSCVRRRLDQIGEEDLARQVWIIRASLATSGAGATPLRRGTYYLSPTPPAMDRARLLSAAGAIGKHLETLALRGEHGATWIGARLTHDRHWSLRPLGIELYDGLCGVTLFLAYLGAVTGEDRYTALGRAALATIRRHIEHHRESITAIGAFEGWGGLIYTLSHLAVLWNDQTLLDEATAIGEGLPPLIERDAAHDIIGGAAGCISGLISLHSVLPTGHTLAVAAQCGGHLLAHARDMEQGIGWLTPGAGSQPLAGYAHGAAGISSALLELAGLTGEERFRAAALAGIAYERQVFVRDAGNWPDLRQLEPEDAPAAPEAPRFMTQWCHGAPGVGLARVQALRHVDQAAIREEIDIAARTTLAEGFGRNHSLCHGDFGNLETLVMTARALDELYWHAQAQRIAASIVDSFDREGWLCGIPVAIDSPGLMNGLAGIGYALLRLAEPDRVPPVLTLAPPVQGVWRHR